MRLMLVTSDLLVAVSAGNLKRFGKMNWSCMRKQFGRSHLNFNPQWSFNIFKVVINDGSAAINSYQ